MFRRLKKDVGDLPIPTLQPPPNDKLPPLWQGIPTDLSAPTSMPPLAGSGGDIMPLPPKNDDTTSQILEAMNKPINPNFGLGFSYVQPTLIGGDLTFPSGNILRPEEHVGGNFGIARPVNVRYGMQGGPFYPWQDPNYAKNMATVMNEPNLLQNSFKKDSASGGTFPRVTNDQPIPEKRPLVLPPQESPFVFSPSLFPNLPPLQTSSKSHK